MNQEEFDICFNNFMERHPNYATPGAKRHWFRIKVGYLILAFGCVLGIWAISNHDTNNLKNQINASAVSNCVGSIKIYTKYNDLVDSIIQTRVESLNRDIESGNKNQAKIDRSAIRRYRNDKIIPPSVPICKKIRFLR